MRENKDYLLDRRYLLGRGSYTVDDPEQLVSDGCLL